MRRVRNASDRIDHNNDDAAMALQETNRSRNNEQVTPICTPTGSVSRNDYGTTLAGSPRQRIAWTTEMNVAIMKAYYKATCAGRVVSGYRQQMHLLFLQEYPQLSHLTEQNIADRRNAIVRRNLLPSQIISTIENEVRIEIEAANSQEARIGQEEANVQQDTGSTQQQNIIVTQLQDIRQQQQQGQNTIDTQHTEQNTGIIEIVKEEFRKAKIEFDGLHPNHRPTIRKPIINKQLGKIVNIINQEVLTEENNNIKDFEELTTTIYCGAVAAYRTQVRINKKENLEQQNRANQTNNNHNINKEKGIKKNNNKGKKDKGPSWKIRLENRIAEIRADLGILYSKKNGNNSRRISAKASKVKRKYKIHTQFENENITIEQYIDTAKQKLAKYVNRLNRYNKSLKRKNDNIIFSNNEKKFYKKITEDRIENSKETMEIKIEEIEKYWKEKWETPIEHRKDAIWIKTIVAETEQISQMDEHIIDEATVRQVIKKTHNWKQPGLDKIQNYWIKKFNKLHPIITYYINKFINEPAEFPKHLAQGITYLKPKVEKPNNSAQFRPITCLNTLYKIFTACITKVINKHIEKHNILAEQQKGNRAGSLGCKEQLIIDSIIQNLAINNKRNLNTAFIDYEKAYDSVPHTWLIEILKIYKVDPIIVHCLENIMQQWVTQVQVNINGVQYKSGLIQILRGLHQGDSFSPLWFCTAINPLSTLLEKAKYGFKIKEENMQEIKISHNLYMDDVKLYANNRTNLNKLLKITEQFSKDIRMNFGVDKCKTQNIYKGKHTPGEDYVTTEEQQIQPLKENEVYKYLGIQQTIRIKHTEIKKRIRKEFERRLNKITRTGLNSKNITKAINSYAIPVLTYTFGVLKWSVTELEALDCKIRSTLAKNRYHHPHSAIERVNIPRNKGGRGIINIKNMHNKQIVKIKDYFKKKATKSIIHKAVNAVDDNLTPLDLQGDWIPEIRTIEDLINNWKQKPIHGKHPNIINKEDIDLEMTNKWLKRGKMFPETEGFVIAIQDKVIATKNYLKYIIRASERTDDKCRKCKNTAETIEHIINGCTILTQTQYKNRHDILGKIIHCNVCHKLNFIRKIEPHYKYKPEAIQENNRYVIYWDRSVLMDTNSQTEQHNRPDMIIIYKEEEKAQVIDFAVPLDKNLQETYNKKKEKYQQVSQYLKSTKNLKSVEIIPVIISSTGTIPKATVEAIRKIGLERKVLEIAQQQIIISSSSIVREFLDAIE